jgi:Holliday junction resolvase RusA-like endonuclease
VIAFDVYGIPAQQGSKRIVPTGAGPRLIETNDRAKREWRNLVADAARQAIGDRPALDGPLRAVVLFRFPMPKSRRKADRLRGWRWKDTAPDVDKLARNLGDALTAAGAIRDDARIVSLHADKIETVGWTGLSIEVCSADGVSGIDWHWAI